MCEGHAVSCLSMSHGVPAVCADLLQITIWLTPAGTVDEGGVQQPAYLNFDIALLGPPAGNQMEVGALPDYVNPQSLC